MKKILLSSLLVLSLGAISQSSSQKRYTDKKGNSHLCGPISISDIQEDSSFNGWWIENYEQFSPQIKQTTWKENLSNKTVDIYLGTWCGDSKEWVPKFVKLWDDLGLNRNQLNFIALYNGDDQYKQGPNHEEKGKQIHRVPTFIFKENEKEIARIVEFPQTSLETDLAQIALGFPTSPNYGAANYLFNVFEQQSIDSVYANYQTIFRETYSKIGKSSELNTLGYVLLRRGRIKEALVAFHFNTFIFKYNPNVYDSYGEALAMNDETEKAIKQYEKTLEIKPDDKNALEQLAKLKEKK